MVAWVMMEIGFMAKGCVRSVGVVMAASDWISVPGGLSCREWMRGAAMCFALEGGCPPVKRPGRTMHAKSCMEGRRSALFQAEFEWHL